MDFKKTGWMFVLFFESEYSPRWQSESGNDSLATLIYGKLVSYFDVMHAFIHTYMRGTSNLSHLAKFPELSFPNDDVDVQDNRFNGVIPDRTERRLIRLYSAQSFRKKPLRKAFQLNNINIFFCMGLLWVTPEQPFYHHSFLWLKLKLIQCRKSCTYLREIQCPFFLMWLRDDELLWLQDQQHIVPSQVYDSQNQVVRGTTICYDKMGV